MATQTLKYGTIVLIGLAVTGGIYYESARHQVYAKDCIEIIEGVREREMIATAISGTNRITLQIATNRSSLVALDSVIVGLIPKFVNQEQISTWASGVETNPPHWTEEDLYTHVGLSASGMTPYPYQIRTNELWERFNILKHLVYTDDPTTWATNNTYSASHSVSTNFSYLYATNWGGPYNFYTNADQLFSDGTTAGLSPTNFLSTLAGTWDECISALDGTLTTTLGGLPPSKSWGSSITVYSLQVYISVGFIAGPNYFQSRWGASRWLDASSSAVQRDANMACNARSIPISRTDSYYYNGAGIGSVLAGTNTITTWSSFVSADGDSSGCANFSYSVTVPSTNTSVSMYGAYVQSVVRSSPNFTETNITAGANTTNLTLRNCIHKWDVERCRE